MDNKELDKIRAEFEAWAKDANFDMDIHEGDYLSLLTETAWATWQAVLARVGSAAPAAAAPEGALPPLPKPWLERLYEAQPDTRSYPTGVKHEIGAAYKDAEIAEWRARAAVEADRAQRPENANQPLCDSALRAEPAANACPHCGRLPTDPERCDWIECPAGAPSAELTDEEITELYMEYTFSEPSSSELAFALAVEAETATRCRAEGGDGAPEAVDVSADRAQQGEPVRGGMVPLSKDGLSVWIDGEGEVPLCYCAATKAAEPDDAPPYVPEYRAMTDHNGKVSGFVWVNSDQRPVIEQAPVPDTGTPTAGAVEGWISVTDERTPKGRTPILVAVNYVRYGEHEDGTLGEWYGQIVTEGEYIPQHGGSGGYFTSYSSPHGDSEAITHWMTIPAAPQPPEAKAGVDA